jgi:hypothetical protein
VVLYARIKRRPLFNFRNAVVSKVNSESICECWTSNAHPRNEYRSSGRHSSRFTSHGKSIEWMYVRASGVRRRHLDDRRAVGSYAGRSASYSHDRCEAFRRFTLGELPRFCTNSSARVCQSIGISQIPCCTNQLHIWRLEEWYALFPEAELWILQQNQNASKPSPFACILRGLVMPGWSNDLDQVVFRGNLFVQEFFFFHKRSRTLILADFIQNHAIEKGRPLLNAFLKISGVAYPNGGVPLDIRLSFTDRTLARRSFEKLLLRDFDKLIIAHGVCIGKDAKPFVQRAFRWLRC